MNTLGEIMTKETNKQTMTKELANRILSCEIEKMRIEDEIYKLDGKSCFRQPWAEIVSRALGFQDGIHAAERHDGTV